MRYRTEVRDVNIVNSSISVGGVVLMPVKTQEYAKLSMGYTDVQRVYARTSHCYRPTDIRNIGIANQYK